MYLDQGFLTQNFLSASGITPSPGARVWFVNNSSSGLPVGAIAGSDGNRGDSPREPFSTLSQAITAATAGRGDVIVVMPGHAETLTSATTISKAGLQIVGCKIGNKRPTFTINGAVDLFSLTGANITLQGLECNIVTTDAATAFVNVAAANCTLRDLYMIPSATAVNVVDCITIASGGNDLLIDSCEIHNTTVAVNSFVSIEAAVARLTIQNCYFSGDTATGGIIDGATATQIHFKNVTVRTVGSAQPACTLDSNPTGTIEECVFLGTHTTLATNFNPGNATRLKNNWVLEETDASVQATNIVPALDTN